MIVHATAVARRIEGGWRAALLFGPPGAGKSDLALRALERGWRLVADDYAVVWISDGRLFVRAPDPIADCIEARGLGVMAEPALSLAEAWIAVRCATGAIERLPEAETMAIAGGTLPAFTLSALETSALAKLDRALSTRALGAGSGRAYWTRSRNEQPADSSGSGAKGRKQEA
jgi:hypothetical protein